jgi:hypothetical protein
MTKFLHKNWQAITYIFFAIGIRLWNFQNSLYFFYDQGRDAWAIDKIIHGHPVLVGPTTGLSGFFLGPLWFYLGVPGYLLTAGNPYGIALWYMLFAFLAIPLFWWISHQLFKDRFWALACALLLAVIPGSLQASQYIWNPLISVPLMSAALICFWKVRNSQYAQRWLWAGFFCLALTLQSEFAYAIFYLPILFVLIPWLRKKFDWRDFVGSILVVGITGIPQVFFELRNKFIMSNSLLRSMASSSEKVSWSELFARRPEQLLNTSRELITGPGNKLPILVPVLLLFFGLGFLAVFLMKKNSQKFSDSQFFLWQLVTLFAFIPYPFYMIWRGNHGNFFPYYLTSHFIFLIPLIVLGMYQLGEFFRKIKFARMIVLAADISIIVVLIGLSAHHWKDVYLEPNNQGGLAKMIQATEKLYEWQQMDGQNPGTVKVFTPNIYTEQYDYLMYWYAHANHRPLFKTLRYDSDQVWYVLLERKAQAEPAILKPWYQTVTVGGHKTREEQIGVLTLETWQK